MNNNSVAGGIRVPTKLQIFTHLLGKEQWIGLADLMTHFQLSSEGEQDALQARMRQMCGEGLVLDDEQDRYRLSGKMKAVTGRIQGHPEGFGFVVTDNETEDLYLQAVEMEKVLHGDRVLARMGRRRDFRGRSSGYIVEVMEQERHITGLFQVIGTGGIVKPDNPRYARDIRVPADQVHHAGDGDIVVVRITGHPMVNRRVVGEVVEVVGTAQTQGMETEITIREHELPHHWPREVEAEISKIGNRDSFDIPADGSRRDIRDLTLLTIDGMDARDFDDAVYCAPTSSGWRLVVAIADVSHYVEAGSALDLEALNRGNSVYFPDQVIPMLPEHLSNGICSLNPDEDRLCMVCDMQFDGSGHLLESGFYPGLMNSRARMTYEVVHEIVAHRDPEQRQAWAHVVENLDHLYRLSRLLKENRVSRGAIDFSFPEPRIEFGPDRQITRIAVRERNEAHGLIEECMLAANICAAQALQEHFGENSVYRNHYGPEMTSLRELKTFLNGMGLSLGGGDDPQARDYSQLIDSVAHRGPVAEVVKAVLLRSLSRAVYGPTPAGHFALAYPVYTHFTSPIRRYSDLVVHRQIKQILARRTAGEGRDVLAPGRTLQEVTTQCSDAERRADDATWEVIARLKAGFMRDKIGEKYKGVITGVKEFGVFVQLKNLFVDGLVHVSSLGFDYYEYDPARLQLVGQASGERFRLGDTVLVRVSRVDMEGAKINFELARSTRPRKHRRRRRMG